MNIDGKEVILIVSIALAFLLMGTIFGFFIGAWAGSSSGFDEGVNAGIDYTNCVVEETPLYGTVTDRILDDCAEKYIYESY